MQLRHARVLRQQSRRRRAGLLQQGAVRAQIRKTQQRVAALARAHELAGAAETNDGFEIARRDLDIRGPGEFMGARQSGDALLRFADLGADSALLEQARAAAPRLLAQDPRVAQLHVDRWLGGKAEFLKA